VRPRGDDRDAAALDLAWEELREERSAPAPRTVERIRSGESVVRAFEELYDLGVDALLAKRHAEAYVHFEAASKLRPEDPSVNANLNRLREMGYAA
jgi:hypothetical protein